MSYITSDMSIGDILKKYSEQSQQMIKMMEAYGLYCVDCHANTLETLRNGVLGHGLGEDVLEDILQKLNQIIKGDSVSVKKDFQIMFTENALDQIKILLEQEDDINQYFRLSVVSGGCAGSSYQMIFVKNHHEGDIVLTKKDLTICIAEKDLDILNGLEVDYIKTDTENSFKFSNPNVTETCDCGTSFKLKT